MYCRWPVIVAFTQQTALIHHSTCTAVLPLLLQEKRVLELERMKGKAESACRKLESDILSMKQQKVGGHSTRGGGRGPGGQRQTSCP
jgi:hypothetical protein